MFFQEMELHLINLVDLEDLAAQWMNMKRRVIPAKTLARRITSMRSFGRCMGVPVLVDYTAPTPARAIPHPLPGLAKDLQAMLAVARNDEQRTLIALTGLCGCRITEARDTRPEDFDLHDMVLTIRGKGDKTRKVPISPLAWSVMCSTVTRAMLDRSTTVVEFTDRHAREIITRLGSRAGISRPVSTHDLRATFATIAYNNSKGNIRAVQELLGHSSVVQTQLYTGVAMAAMRGAANFVFDEED